MGKRVAAIYDIHGNDAALEAVLLEIRRQEVDLILVGGDLAWGPQPRPVMNRLLSLDIPTKFIRGNADREVGHRYGVENGLDETVALINQWCADQLTDQQRTFLRELPEQAVVNVEGLGDVLFVHGSPRNDEEAIRIHTSEQEIIPMLENVGQNIIVCGHTHIQFDREIGEKRVINAGSVGLQSRAQGACWALLGPDICLFETLYDRERAAANIRQSGVPLAEEFAQHILNPPEEGP